MNIFFASCTNLGAEQHLPDDLFKGLTSLAILRLCSSGLQKFPNMDDLTALKNLGATHTKVHMNDTESETQFDGLVSVETIYVEGNLLTRVPSMKNMQNLRALQLEDNQITAIFPGDFRGAQRLVMLTLGGNRITSVATEAFANLAAFQVKPSEFNITNADGTPFMDAIGIGLWPHMEPGYFGGNQEWAHVPMSFSPNPVQCQWVGPLLSDFNCSRCVLGYEAISAGNATCAKPAFRPRRGWRDSKERAQLQLQDMRGDVVKSDTGTGNPTLLTDQTYTIPAPKLLEQKDTMFVGYEQPYSKIKYELDFLLGAEVDIGCGTSVVGNGAADEKIPKSEHGHPLSMLAFSFQWYFGRGDLNADPPDYGHYPWSCPRYHRFRVTRPGNFTFVRAAAWRTFALKCHSLSLSFFLALLVFLLVVSPLCAPSPQAPLLVGLPHNGWLFHQLSNLCVIISRETFAQDNIGV